MLLLTALSGVTIIIRVMRESVRERESEREREGGGGRERDGESLRVVLVITLWKYLFQKYTDSNCLALIHELILFRHCFLK